MRHIKPYNKLFESNIEDVLDNLLDIFDKYNITHESDIPEVDIDNYRYNKLGSEFYEKYSEEYNNWRYSGDNKIIIIISNNNMRNRYSKIGTTWSEISMDLKKLEPIINDRTGKRLIIKYNTFGLISIEVR